MNQIKDQWDLRQKELSNTNRAVLFKNFPDSFNQKLHQTHLAFIKTYLPAEPALILDVGCGYGRLSLPLKEHYPNAEFNGIEFCDEFAHAFTINVGPCFKGSVTDFQTDKQYDTILIVTLLMYLSPQERVNALKKLWNTLPVKGKMILIEPYYNFLIAWRRALQFKFFSPTGGEVKYFKSGEFEGLLLKNLPNANLLATKYFNMPYLLFPRLHLGLVLEKGQ